MRISGSITSIYPRLLGLLLAGNRVEQPARRHGIGGTTTKEVMGVQLQFPARYALLATPERKLNYRFAAAEALWMILGRDDVKSLARVNPRILETSDDGQVLAGAYGPRIAEQLPWLLRKLQDDPQTRQAVDIWRPTPAAGNDTPCTLSLQFLGRYGFLHCLATMRSSDAWLGVPYDAFSFACVLQAVAGQVGLTPGFVMMTLASSHLYEAQWEASLQLAEAYSQLTDAPVTECSFSLEPLQSPAQRDALRRHGDRALDGLGALGEMDADLPPGWTRLVRAVAAPTSALARATLTGAYS